MAGALANSKFKWTAERREGETEPTARQDWCRPGILPPFARLLGPPDDGRPKANGTPSKPWSPCWLASYGYRRRVEPVSDTRGSRGSLFLGVRWIRASPDVFMLSRGRNLLRSAPEIHGKVRQLVEVGVSRRRQRTPHGHVWHA